MRVESRGPLDTASVLSTLTRHEIEGLTETDPGTGTHRRMVILDGRPVELELDFRPDGIEVEVRDGEADPARVSDLVRRWFDLDADIEAIDGMLAGHELFAEQVAAQPGVRLTGYPDRWEAAAMIVLGQQISLGAARTFGARLVSVGRGEHAGLRGFPPPERIAAEPVAHLRARLGTTRARAATINAVASLFARDPQAGTTELAGLPGIGPWTLACFSIRGIGLTDVFPGGDAVLRRALGDLGAREAEGLAARWKPVRSYAAVRLWAGATVTPPTAA